MTNKINLLRLWLSFFCLSLANALASDSVGKIHAVHVNEVIRNWNWSRHTTMWIQNSPFFQEASSSDLTLNNTKKSAFFQSKYISNKCKPMASTKRWETSHRVTAQGILETGAEEKSSKCENLTFLPQDSGWLSTQQNSEVFLWGLYNTCPDNFQLEKHRYAHGLLDVCYYIHLYP